MSDRQKMSEWQVPPQASDEVRKLGWITDVTEEGQAWIKEQRGTEDIPKALDIIAGKDVGPKIADYRSHINTNHLKKNVREIVGALSKIRACWGFYSSNSSLAKEANVLNKVTQFWWLDSAADMAIHDALAWASVTCTGWVRPVYRRDMAGQGHGDVSLLSYGSPSILPFQLPPSGDFQSAYAVTILDELPVFMAHAMFPAKQDQLNPTSSMFWHAQEIRTASKGNLWARLSGFRRSTKSMSAQSEYLCPLRYTYILDLSVNKTDQMIPMGEPGTSWYYEVPFVGMDIPAGRDSRGTPLFRKATANDARLYPYRRLMISGESCICYDGPAFDWHGRVPVIPFCFDRWPWEPLGFSPVRDGYEIQQTINENFRGIADKFRSQNNVALAYDINSVTKKEAEQFDPMQPNVRVGFDGTSLTEPFKMPVPPEVLRVMPEQMAFTETLKQTMDEQHAIKDVQALAEARMSQDDLEKLLEIKGPIIEDMSRQMEPPMRELGNQVKYLFLQYYDTARIMPIVGADNMSITFFDFDPKSMVPSHLPGEDPGTGDTPRDSSFSKIQRARAFASQLNLLISPNTLHEITQMGMRLGLIQLRKANVKISSETIAKAWNVQNYGETGGSTEIEKWNLEQEADLEFAIRAKAIAAMVDGTGAGDIPIVPIAPPNPEGRPPSGQQSPALKMKPNEGRTVVTESAGGGRIV